MQVTSTDQVIDNARAAQDAEQRRQDEVQAAATIALLPRNAGTGNLQMDMVELKFKLLFVCADCGHRQFSKYDKCMGCDVSVNAIPLMTSVKKMQLRDEYWEQAAKYRRETGKSLAPLGMNSTHANFGKKWRPMYGRITHQKMRQSDGEWIHKDTWQPNQQRIGVDERYTQRRFDGFVDLLKTGHIECQGEREILGKLYNKFKEENGITNVHLVYQAAWFIDWWCLYVGRDMSGINYNKRKGERTSVDKKSNYTWYISFNGNPPAPFRTGFCDYAWEAFYISKPYWFSPGTKVIVEPHETHKIDQQDVVDHLWHTFLNTGQNSHGRGYMLDHIPEKLKASWNQSWLKGATVASALPHGTAAQSSTMTVASPMLALPVSLVSERSPDRDRSISVATSSSN